MKKRKLKKMPGALRGNVESLRYTLSDTVSIMYYHRNVTDRDVHHQHRMAIGALGNKTDELEAGIKVVSGAAADGIGGLKQLVDALLQRDLDLAAEIIVTDTTGRYPMPSAEDPLIGPSEAHAAYRRGHHDATHTNREDLEFVANEASLAYLLGYNEALIELDALLTSEEQPCP